MSKKQTISNKLLIIEAVILVFVVGLLVVVKLNHTASSTSSDILLQDQEVSDLEFVDASLESNRFKVVVHNLLESDYNLKTIDIKFLDSNGNEVITLSGYIGNKIDANGMKELVTSTDADLSKAVTIKYFVKK